MTAERGQRTAPLRPTDPRHMGPFPLLARLGEGGMGTVYLGRNAAGKLVAIKVIRDDLAGQDQFRARFRREVNRARQVPPFCTAEVLDADPDHEPPYLVVEFVDGPDLASVVREQGPLSGGNLHALAIGVASALTAIHGAGVIHRDLKPTNVLLAPGSPKVIDFGIARAVGDGDTAHTSTGQLVGTVSYMSPERLGPAGADDITPAADVFAWGAIVMYAGTGRTPWGGDMPAIVAARICTQPPNLDGLSDSLRPLVARALAADPRQRPTARELLDHLLTGSERTPAVPAAPTVTLDALTVVEDALTVPAARPSRRRWPRRLLATGTVLLVGTGGALALKGVDLPSISAAAPHSTAAAVPYQPIVTDSLASPGTWMNIHNKPNEADCIVRDGLTVEKRTPGPFRCAGSLKTFRDFRATVDVTLETATSCAGIWFRFDGSAGYVLRICADQYQLVTHGLGSDSEVRELDTYGVEHVPVGASQRVTIEAKGAELLFFRDGRQVGHWADTNFPMGRVVLGVFPTAATDEPPYRVRFANIEIGAFGAL